jgi:hypothetical protein
MAVSSPSVDVVDLVDHSRLGRFQLGLLLLCGACLVVGGFARVRGARRASRAAATAPPAGPGASWRRA